MPRTLSESCPSSSLDSYLSWTSRFPASISSIPFCISRIGGTMARISIRARITAITMAATESRIATIKSIFRTRVEVSKSFCPRTSTESAKLLRSSIASLTFGLYSSVKSCWADAFDAAVFSSARVDILFLKSLTAFILDSNWLRRLKSPS